MLQHVLYSSLLRINLVHFFCRNPQIKFSLLFKLNLFILASLLRNLLSSRLILNVLDSFFETFFYLLVDIVDPEPDFLLFGVNHFRPHILCNFVHIDRIQERIPFYPLHFLYNLHILKYFIFWRKHDLGHHHEPFLFFVRKCFDQIAPREHYETSFGDGSHQLNRLFFLHDAFCFAKHDMTLKLANSEQNPRCYLLFDPAFSWSWPIILILQIQGFFDAYSTRNQQIDIILAHFFSTNYFIFVQIALLSLLNQNFEFLAIPRIKGHKFFSHNLLPQSTQSTQFVIIDLYKRFTFQEKTFCWSIACNYHLWEEVGGDVEFRIANWLPWKVFIHQNFALLIMQSLKNANFTRNYEINSVGITIKVLDTVARFKNSCL